MQQTKEKIIPEPEAKPTFSLMSHRYGQQDFYHDSDGYLWFLFNGNYQPIGSTIFPHITHVSCPPAQVESSCRHWWSKEGHQQYDRDDVYYLKQFKAHAIRHYEHGYDRFVECYDDSELLELFKENNCKGLHQAIQLTDSMIQIWKDCGLLV